MIDFSRKLKNFGPLEFLVTSSLAYVVIMLIWTGSTRSAVVQKANDIKFNHKTVVDFINKDCKDIYFGNYDIIYCCNTIFDKQDNKNGKYAKAVAEETTYESGEGNAVIVPIPIQHIAASLYKDEKHNYETCLYYDQNFKIAKELLKETHPNLKIPDAGFYLWLPVKDDLKTTIDLWRDYSVRVMPGTFMAENVSGENPCKGFLRIALVHKKEIVIEALQRISNYFKNNHV